MSDDTVVKKEAKSQKKASAKKKTGKPKRPFPVVTLEEATAIPLKIKELNGGNPWPPQDLANALDTSHKTNPFFYLTAGSRDYGFTEGTRYSAKIALAEIGRAFAYAPSPDTERDSLQKAFFNVPIFKDVYNHYNGSTLPELKYLANTLEGEFHLAQEFHEDFHRIFQANCRFIQKYGDIVSEESVIPAPGGERTDRIINASNPIKKNRPSRLRYSSVW